MMKLSEIFKSNDILTLSDIEKLEKENETLKAENKRLEGEVRHMEETSENSWIEYCRIGDENKQLRERMKCTG